MKFAATALLVSALAAALPVNSTEPIFTVTVSTTNTYYTTVWANCTQTVSSESISANSSSFTWGWPSALTSTSLLPISTSSVWPESTSSALPSSTGYSLESAEATTTKTTTMYITSSVPLPTLTSATQSSSSSESTVTKTISTTAASAASGTIYAGDGTWYYTGLGACGKVNTDSDYIVAIGHGLFDAYTPGTNPNVNTLCDRKIRVWYQDKSVVVTAVDRCEGCKPYDLDFSPAAFSQLADQSKGRIQITWEWI